MKHLNNELTSKGFEVLSTREPGGIHISEQIRNIILNPEHTNMEKRTEALLYAAARRQHLIEKVIPALQEGRIVLCDRFIDSSLAYQGYARGLGMDEVLAIKKVAECEGMPGYNLDGDIEQQIGLELIALNDDREKNRVDMATIQFHRKVYDRYDLWLKKFPNPIKQFKAAREQ